MNLPTDPPGPRAPHTERNAELVRRALSGEDFMALSRAYGVSRERVRQIVRAQTGLSGPDLGEVRAATRTAVREQLARDTATQEPDAACADIADRSGLGVGHVESLLGPAEAARRRPDRSVTDAAAEGETIAALRRVATLPGGQPLSGPFYDRHRGDAVTSTRIIQVFGTWRSACEKAGVVPQAAARSDYTQRWSTADCLRWVSAYLATTDKPSFARFDQWARTQEGAPSAGTVRLRCGKWIETVRAAYALLADESESDANRA